MNNTIISLLAIAVLAPSVCLAAVSNVRLEGVTSLERYDGQVNSGETVTVLWDYTPPTGFELDQLVTVSHEHIDFEGFQVLMESQNSDNIYVPSDATDGEMTIEVETNQGIESFVVYVNAVSDVDEVPDFIYDFALNTPSYESNAEPYKYPTYYPGQTLDFQWNIPNLPEQYTDASFTVTSVEIVGDEGIAHSSFIVPIMDGSASVVVPSWVTEGTYFDIDFWDNGLDDLGGIPYREHVKFYMYGTCGIEFATEDGPDVVASSTVSVSLSQKCTESPEGSIALSTFNGKGGINLEETIYLYDANIDEQSTYSFDIPNVTTQTDYIVTYHIGSTTYYGPEFYAEPKKRTGGGGGGGGSSSSRSSKKAEVKGVATTTVTSNVAAPTSTQSPTNTSFTRYLKLGDTGMDVKALQVFLNTHGYVIATTGPGSPGQETQYFGLLTQAALIKFQLANNIAPAVGFFGPLSMNAVLTILAQD